MDEYITITDAAKLAGYRNPGTLQAAARQGKLQTVEVGGAMRFTTRGWLSAYLAAVKPRGKPRGGHPAEDAWFYTPEWQAKNREADEAKAAGRFTRHYSDEDFLASLAEPVAGHADVRQA